MKNKKIYSLLLVVVLAIVSIYLFAILDVGLQKSAKKVEIREYNIYRTLEVLVLIALGVLIEYKKVISIFKNSFHINKYSLIFSLGLIIILVIPYNITVYLGLAYPSSIRGTISYIVNSINTRTILSILAGILLIRSLASSKTKREMV